MTLKFFKLLQRNIEDDLNIIIPSNTDFLDELVEDCLPLLKGCVLIGACPSEQIAAIIFSFLVFLLDLLQLVLCSGQGILCCLDRSLIFIQMILYKVYRVCVLLSIYKLDAKYKKCMHSP